MTPTTERLGPEQAFRDLVANFGKALVAVRKDGPEACPGLETHQFCGGIVNITLRYKRRASVIDWRKQCDFMAGRGVKVTTEARLCSRKEWEIWELEEVI